MVQLKFINYHRSGNKNVCQGYVNLELLINEKFVAYGTMVKILATLRSFCANACYLMQKLKPAMRRVYSPQCFGNKFFYCVWKNKYLKHSYHQKVKLWYKFIAKTLRKIHPLPITISTFCIKQHPLTQGLFKINKILTIAPYAANSSFTDNTKFTFTLTNVIISKLVVNIWTLTASIT